MTDNLAKNFRGAQKQLNQIRTKLFRNKVEERMAKNLASRYAAEMAELTTRFRYVKMSLNFKLLRFVEDISFCRTNSKGSLETVIFEGRLFRTQASPFPIFWGFVFLIWGNFSLFFINKKMRCSISRIFQNTYSHRTTIKVVRWLYVFWLVKEFDQFPL